MTIHYHGTPITPMPALYELAGRHFCVSYAAPTDVRRVHQIGQSVMLDNGAFSAWRVGRPTDWPGYYRWAEQWLGFPTTWAVIPDVITGTADDQDQLLSEWPFGQRGAPVWHMHEPVARLLRLVDQFHRVCIGSSAQFAVVLSVEWQRRMDEAWNGIVRAFGRSTPWIHMLRGMACCGHRWPFASVDSTDVARNHNRPQNTPRKMVDRWDAIQCPAIWNPVPEQEEMFS